MYPQNNQVFLFIAQMNSVLISLPGTLDHDFLLDGNSERHKVHYINLELQTTTSLWLFQADDSKSLQ